MPDNESIQLLLSTPVMAAVCIFIVYAVNSTITVRSEMKRHARYRQMSEYRNTHKHED